MLRQISSHSFTDLFAFCGYVKQFVTNSFISVFKLTDVSVVTVACPVWNYYINESLALCCSVFCVFCINCQTVTCCYCYRLTSHCCSVYCLCTVVSNHVLFFISFSFLFHFLTNICTHFSSLKTSSIEVKLETLRQCLEWSQHVVI